MTMEWKNKARDLHQVMAGTGECSWREKDWEGPLTRDRAERRGRMETSILVADTCGWQVILAHRFVELIYLGS